MNLLSPVLASALLLFFIGAQIFPAGRPMDGPVVRSKRILIAKGTSILENEVARIVKDSLLKKGFSIKTVHIDTVAGENPDSFRVTLFFNAMKSMQLVEPAKQYQKNAIGRATKILICTVSGELWNLTNPGVDAITAPTEELKPVEVAGRILKSIDQIVGGP